MDAYRRALSAYLDTEGCTQEALAEKIGKAQAVVSRYVTGERFPKPEIARDIDKATSGAVPFALWQQVAMDKMGMERAA